MTVEVIMPKLGLTMTEGRIVQWLVQDGEPVRKGQPVYELETDKITMEVEASADGVLRHAVEVGAVVPVTAVVGYIQASDETLPSSDQPSQQSEPATGQEQPRVLASPAARRKARELGIDLSLVQGSGRQGRISLEDVEGYAAARSEAVRTAADEINASPVARRVASEAGIDLADIEGSGPDGRITRQDVEEAIAAREAGTIPAEPVRAEPAVGELVPLQGIRQVIAERMLLSSHQSAAVTITREVDATELVNMRTQLNEGLSEKLGFRVAYNDILVKIVARALREFPRMNARQEGDALRLLAQVNVGLAVDTERGLLVPVVRDADQKTVVEIARDRRDLIDRALAGKSFLDELSGGTFTITNLGMFGVDAFTPIINPPELAILGVGRIVEKPVGHQGEIYLRPQMVLSLTFDHRLVDGAPAARFLQRVTDLIEKPYLLLVNDFD